jgi:hypothetical protein
MATATRTETVEPLPEREPGHAGLPVSDAAISDHTFSAAASSCIVQAHASQFKQCYQWLKLKHKIGSIIPVTTTVPLRIAQTSWRSHNRDTIAWSPQGFRKWGDFRTLNVA